jgi:translation initiation factor 2 subunit 1
MYYKRTGLPEEGELLLCTVTNIQYSSVFVKIDDFGISGMIHISEIAAGRIRNIRDYVKEGKKVVCKVLRIHKERGHVDLSLRRVTESQRRKTVNEVKLEQKAESIIDYVAKKNKIDTKKLYNEIFNKVNKEYAYLHHAFEDVVAGHLDLSTIVDKKYLEQMQELVDQRFKVKNVEISGVLSLSTYDGKGIDIVKKTLEEAEKNGAKVRYLGGGNYNLLVEAPDFKEAEKILKKAVDVAIDFMKNNNGEAEFKRTDK